MVKSKFQLLSAIAWNDDLKTSAKKAFPHFTKINLGVAYHNAEINFSVKELNIYLDSAWNYAQSSVICVHIAQTFSLTLISPSKPSFNPVFDLKSIVFFCINFLNLYLDSAWNYA